MTTKRVKTEDSSVEVCKMPWFLIEVVPPLRDGETNTNGRRDHFIVHSVDICDRQSKNMYVDGKVRFQHNSTVLDGRVLIAAENRAWIEKELPNYTGKAMEKLRGEKMYTVLYSAGPDNFVLSIIPESQIYLLPPIRLRSLEGVICVNDVNVIATVLHKADDLVISDCVLESLKAECFELGYKGVDQATTVPGEEEYLFIQYCNGPSTLIYAILNAKHAHWTEENLYKDVVVYFEVNDVVYQAIILHKSSNYEELSDLLNVVKKGSWELFYTEDGTVPEKFVPLDNEMIEKLIQRAQPPESD